MRRLLEGGAAAAGDQAPTAAAAAAGGSSYPLAPQLSPPAAASTGSGARMGMAVSRSVLFCGIGAAAIVWLIALFIIVRSCMRRRRQGSATNESTQGRPVAAKPRKRVFAAPLPVLIIQPDRRSLDLGYQDDQRWGSLVLAPCTAKQDGKLPGTGSSGGSGSQFIVEFAEAGVWLPADESPDAGGPSAACSPGSSAQGSGQP